MNRAALACAVTVGGALYYLYALFLLSFLLHVDVSGLDTLQWAVVITMVGRLLAVLVVFGIRRTVPITLFLLLLVDFSISIGVVGLYLFTRSSDLFLLAHSIDSAAITTFLVGLPACLIFWTTFEMVTGRRIARVLLSVLLEVALIYFLAGHLLQAQAQVAFGDFPQILILAATNDVAAGTIPQITGLFVILPLTALFCSLLIYGRLCADDRKVPTRTTLALPLLSALVALGWLFFAAFYLQAAFVSLPTRMIVGVSVLLLSFAAIRLLSARATSSADRGDQESYDL